VNQERLEVTGSKARWDCKVHGAPVAPLVILALQDQRVRQARLDRRDWLVKLAHQDHL
jgi:hypothetical protein